MIQALNGCGAKILTCSVVRCCRAAQEFRAERQLTVVQLSGEKPNKNPYFTGVLERGHCYRHELRRQKFVQKSKIFVDKCKFTYWISTSELLNTDFSEAVLRNWFSQFAPPGHWHLSRMNSKSKEFDRCSAKFTVNTYYHKLLQMKCLQRKLTELDCFANDPIFGSHWNSTRYSWTPVSGSSALPR